MTQHQFNNKVIELANKVFLIRKYSYQRRGAKFDPRQPDLMLSPCERERIEIIEKEFNELVSKSVEWSKEWRQQ